MNDVVVKEILRILTQKGIDYSFYGNKEAFIKGFSPVTEYQKGTLTWVKSRDAYLNLLLQVAWEELDLVVVDFETQKEANVENAIVCGNPKSVFYTILESFWGVEEISDYIGKNTVIEEGALISAGVYIGQNCYIGGQTIIGEKTRVGNNVVIMGKVIIGNNCHIQSGVVIGEDGFGYSKENGRYCYAPHFGGVKIGDNVDIGANSCVARGSMSDTEIGEGCKIDNLCHIGHNDRIGKRVMLTAGVVLAGSVRIEDDAYIAPGVTIRNQISVGKGSIIGIGGVLVKDAEAEYIYVGVPAKPIRKVGKEKL